MCALCTNSYCTKHQGGEFSFRENMAICSQHSEEEATEFLKNVDKNCQKDATGEGPQSTGNEQKTTTFNSKRQPKPKVKKYVPVEPSLDRTSEKEKEEKLESVKCVKEQTDKTKSSSSSSKRQPKAKAKRSMPGEQPPSLDHATGNKKGENVESVKSVEEQTDKTKSSSSSSKRQPKAKAKRSMPGEQPPVFDKSTVNEQDGKVKGVVEKGQKSKENARNFKRQSKTKVKGPLKKKKERT